MQANNKNNPNASISYLQQKQRGIYSEIINPDNSVLFGVSPDRSRNPAGAPSKP